MLGIQNATINNPMLLAASSGRQYYYAYLYEQKRELKKSRKYNKRKEMVEKLEELKRQRFRQHADIKGIQQSAYGLADKAETVIFKELRFLNNTKLRSTNIYIEL